MDLEKSYTDDVSDDMLDDQELINNYWQMPLPKISRPNSSGSNNEVFAFNELIAKNNQGMLDSITENELHDIDQDIDKAMEFGASDYITKPIDTELILNKLKQHLA